MKSTAKALLSLILALFVTCGVLGVTQGTVLALEEEGKGFCYIAMDSDGKVPDDFPEDGYIYIFNPWEEKEYAQDWGGASYDIDSNTLTLDNFNHPNIGLIIDGMTKKNCGSEFKIVLKGDNHIQRIDDGFSGMYVKGSGTLTINENKKAQGGVVTYNKAMESESEGPIPNFHIGEDATVTIYKSPDEVTEYGDVYKSYCISISGYDKETEKPGDYLIYDGKVTPEIEWEEEEMYPASVDYLCPTDLVYVKMNFDTSRLFAEKDNPDHIRLLVDGQVSDSNETYAWLEKHNGKWFVSRRSWYDTDISGPYTGTIPEDLLTSDNTITAYMAEGAPIQSEIYMEANFIYTKNDKFYIILPEIMLVDNLVETDARSDVFCIGEIVHDTPVFQFESGEPYDPWLLDSFTVVSGVSTGAQAAKYMEDNGYEKVIARSWPAEYALRTTNESITFSPDKTSPVSTWVQDGNDWYYYDENGEIATAWQEIGGKWYYFETSGAMVSGWKEIGKKWYYFETSGAMVTGWKEIGKKWYYFETSGAMATGWKQLGGKWYYFDNGGAMATGWKQAGGKWYYFNAGGDMITPGWRQLGGNWYYFNAGGDMATGWQSIGGTWYYFGSSGAMATGWQSVGGTWYYFNAGGDMVTGWQVIGGKWYYFYSSGAMASNTTIDGCTLDSSGAWTGK